MGAAFFRFEDFARELRAAATVDDALAVLQRTIEAMGFLCFDYGLGRASTPHPTSALDLEVQAHFATFRWESLYAERYQAHDLSALISMLRVTPWSYRHEYWNKELASLTREALGPIRDRSVRSGLGIPLHSPGGLFGLLHLGSGLSSAEFDRLDREVRADAALLAAYFHERMLQLLGPEQDRSGLHARERECLLWAGQGKTVWEISVILSLSQSTVKKHLVSAAAKLGVTTRTQAVARATARGLIRP